MNTGTWSAVLFLATSAALLTSGPQPADAATLCVDPGGNGGCFSTIGAAVGAASAGDTIQVAPGTYFEDVIIAKSLSLIGANRANTIIDAKGLSNGIYIDGLDNPGLREVVVTGFTSRNAKFEGILVTNASAVTISENRVINNNLALDVSNPAAPKCPGIPAFETNEDLDCGEGIHLSAVDHSIVANNLVANNSGGILLRDDTGKTHDNLITGNVVQKNPFDCGITLASHALYSGAPTSLRGVDNNTISENESFDNGLGIPGAGAGVGLFISGPGLETSGNVVISNRLTGNGLPGVAMHQHTPNPLQNLNDNLIVGNYIAGNAGDSDIPTEVPTGISLLGTAPVSGTVITLNEFARESIDIAINNAGGTVDVHLNNLNGSGTGIQNSGAGAVNATENWWGCAKGPGAPGCTSVSGSNVVSTPFLTKPVNTTSPK
jgi:parallel beta-helix repeat protein